MRRFWAAFFALFLLFPAALAEGYAVSFTGGAAAVDENGDVVIPAGLYESILVFNDGNGAVSGYAAGVEVDGALKYALLTPSGIPITPHKYASVASAGGDFICGVGNRYRIVLALGVECAMEYSALAYAGGGSYLALLGNINDDIADSLRVLTAGGDEIAAGIGVMYGLGRFSEGLMPLCEGGSMRFGYIKPDGSWAIAPAYEYAGDFSGGYAEVSTLSGHGMIDTTGSAAIDISYDFLAREGGTAIGVHGGMLTAFSVGSDEVRMAFEMTLDGATPRLSGVSVILAGEDAVRVLDLSGAELFSLDADASVSAAGGLYVARGGDWAEKSARLAGADGRMISDSYNTIRLLDGTGAEALFAYGIVAEDSDAPHDMKFGLLRGDGTAVTEPLYDALVCVKQGLYFAQTAEGALLIDADGAVVATITAP